MQSTRNPVRRNRNIGTAKSGHGENNELVISRSWSDLKIFWEKLTRYQVVHRKIKNQQLTILVEETRKGYVHACTPDDIAKAFEFIPIGDWKDLKLVVLRQPKVKEEILQSVWGRLAYYAVLDRHEGAAIFIEAHRFNKPLRWYKSLSTESALELERLRDDGHPIRTDKRYHYIDITLETVRATQLYRTLFHEVGHWVDFRQSVDIPYEAGGNYDSLKAKYDRKLSPEKEAFAHRYADTLRKKLLAKALIPFARRLDEESPSDDKLRKEDFVI
jgi:hypothetical protein